MSKETRGFDFVGKELFNGDKVVYTRYADNGLKRGIMIKVNSSVSKLVHCKEDWTPFEPVQYHETGCSNGGILKMD